MKRLGALIGIVLCTTAAGGADVNELIKQLTDGDNETRRAAACSLREGGAESKGAVQALIRALKDSDMFVRRFSAQALGEIGPGARFAVPALTAALNDTHNEVQSAAAHALGKLGSSGVEALIGILGDDDINPRTRRQAIDSLAKLGGAAHAAVPALTALLKEKTGKNKKKTASEALRVDAAVALGSLATPRDNDTVETLQALTDKEAKTPRNLKQAANMSLRKIKRKGK